MPAASPARRESSESADLTSVQLRSELVSALDEYRRSSRSLDQALGALAGLLVAKWAGQDDSEREAIAAFDGRPFTAEIPDALRLPSWKRPNGDHASAVVEALKEVTACQGAQSAAARYLSRVAPLVIRAAGHSRSTYEQLHDRIRQIDLGSVEGRTLAAHLFDDVLQAVMDSQGGLVGQFTTPSDVAALMLELADPKPGDKVYDPCFGFGELLVGAARRVRATARTVSPRDWTDVQHAGIFGVEVDRLSYTVGLCRTLLAGVDRPDLVLSDALERPLSRNRSTDGYDCILATPPWGRRTAPSSTDQVQFPSRNSETLFLQHVMANLRSGGRAVVALPEGPLYRLGSDRKVRDALLSGYHVDAVVSLPAGTFSPWTGIAVNLLVFRRTAPRSAVRFVSISPKAWAAKLEADGYCVRDNGESERYGFGLIDCEASDGGEVGGETESDAKFQGGAEDGDAHLSRMTLLRGMYELIRHPQELSPDMLLPGVEAWDVPIRDLALRDYELVAKRSGSNALNAEIDRLVAADPSLKVERLERVAEVFTGQSYLRRYTTRSRNADDAQARLVRSEDIQDIVYTEGVFRDDGKEARIATGQVSPLFLNGEGRARVKEKHVLCPLDIAVSTSGIAGDVIFFPIPAGSTDMDDTAASTFDADSPFDDLLTFIPLVATSGVAVLRARSGITPHYLHALLRSPVYQGWLSGHARGASIQRLTLRTLRRLRVPVPPIPVQEAVLDRLSGLRGHEMTVRARYEGSRLPGDALAVLGRLLSGVASDPVTVWLETPLVARLASGSIGGTDSDKFRALLDAIEALKSLVVQAAHGSDRTWLRSGDPRIGTWLGMAQRIATALDGVASVPRGTGRLTVLEIALSRLREALRVLDGTEGPTVDRLHSFTRAMVELSEGEIQTMQESITLDIGLEPAEVIVGVTSEVRLRVTNTSAVPLRSIFVSTRPPVGTGQLPYLADSETHRFPLTVHPRDTTQPLRILVSWRARRLDGVAVRGEVEAPLRVLSTLEVVRSGDEAVRSGDLGASPYIVGNPVDRQEMFFGRADVIGRIKQQLGASTHANVILLEGNRRTGKTSVLRQLDKTDALPGWIPVYCSLQDAEGDDARAGITTRNVFRLLARATGWALHDAGVETWLPDLPGRDPGRPFKLAFRAALNQMFADDHAFESFELYVAAALEAASPKRILLMLDEFDKLQEGIDAGITSPQVPENIRHLLQHQPGLSAIITGSRRLKRLREEYWSALFGLGYRIGISALAVDEARRLVTEPVEGRLGYLPQARDRLVDLCACHPFLIQSLCNRVFEQAASGGGPTITSDTVEQAATEMVRDNEHFRTLWDYAGTARRRLLLALCDRLAEGPDAVNLDLLNVKLYEHGVPLRRMGALPDDIAELRELELLDFDDSYRDGTYRLSVPLMSSWLRMNVDFDELVVRAKHEADPRS